MFHHTWARSLQDRRAGRVDVLGAIALVAILAPAGAAAADEAPTTLRSYPYSATPGGRLKNLNPDAMGPAVGSHSQNLIELQKTAERPSLIPDPQNSLERMLRARELSFVPGRRLDQDPRAAANLDLAAIKLRVSRDSVILRAQFTFN
ncbi:MAG: hypothetical protein ABI831_22900 [Betaproteobacteria bacterium]